MLQKKIFNEREILKIKVLEIKNSQQTCMKQL